MKTNMNSKSCRNCKTTENLRRNGTVCKKCLAEYNNIWWKNLPDEEKKKRNKKYYKNNRAKAANDFDFLIKKWCQAWRNRTGKEYKSRKLLSTDDLIQICLNGLKKFPYIDFSLYKDREKTMATWASIDRVDSTKDYSDINNLECIPLWLNSAKLNISHDELKAYMYDYLSK